MEALLKVKASLDESIKTLPTGDDWCEDISFRLRIVRDLVNQRITDLGGSPKPAEPKKMK